MTIRKEPEVATDQVKRLCFARQLQDEITGFVPRPSDDGAPNLFRKLHDIERASNIRFGDRPGIEERHAGQLEDHPVTRYFRALFPRFHETLDLILNLRFYQ